MWSNSRAALFVEQPTLLRFSGDQALWFLDQLITNKVDDLQDGLGAEALLLTPKGRIVSHLHVLHIGSEALLRAPKDPSLMSFFQTRVFSTRVEIEDVSGELGVIDVRGDADPVLSRAGLPVPPSGAMRVVNERGIKVFRHPADRGLGMLVPPSELQGLIKNLTDAGAIQSATPDVVFAELGVARLGVDFGSDNLPQEAAMERAVHFEKGCYLGQEAVAMTQRGRVKRRLRHLKFRGNADVREVTLNEKPVGSVTTMGDGWAIAMLSSEVEDGDPVTLGGVRASVGDLPGTHRGPGRPSGRELRERLRNG